MVIKTIKIQLLPLQPLVKPQPLVVEARRRKETKGKGGVEMKDGKEKGARKEGRWLKKKKKERAKGG